MSKYFYIILFILLLAGWVYLSRSHRQKTNLVQKVNTLQTGKYTDITSDQLYAMLKNKDFYFVNVHIPYEGEIEKTDAFIPYNELDKNLDKLPKDKNAKIVLYCRSGRMSEEAARKLTELGYTNVYNHILGMHDWQAKGYQFLKGGDKNEAR